MDSSFLEKCGRTGHVSVQVKWELAAQAERKKVLQHNLIF